MTKKSKTSDLINAEPYRNWLLNEKVPYTATSTAPFHLKPFLKEITYQEDDKELFVMKNRQFEMWSSCLEPLDGSAPVGWTACFTSQGDISRPDAMAAMIMGRAIQSGKLCRWINLTSGLPSDKMLKEQLTPGNPGNLVQCLVLSGLRWDSTSNRFDKAFDLLRMTPDSCIKIITGVGETPIGMARALGVPVTRVAFLKNRAEVNL